MKRMLAIALLGLTIAGCGPKANDVLPTLAPTLAPAMPATATPAATAVPPTDVPIDRATLPPTWTPADEPTDTVVAPTDTPVPIFTEIPTLAACGPFDIDREKSAATFTVGQPEQVFWVPVQGAVRYHISVLDAFNQEILNDYAVDTNYTFKPDLFEKGKRYAWKVYPVDTLGQQMCLAAVGDMSPAIGS